MEDISLAPARWVRAMSEHLPHHRDQFFLSLQAAMHGCYQPHEDIQPVASKEPGAIANRRLDEFSNRADAAIRQYQERKAMRGR